jgi:hypothetical protein
VYETLSPQYKKRLQRWSDTEVSPDCPAPQMEGKHDVCVLWGPPRKHQTVKAVTPVMRHLHKFLQRRAARKQAGASTNSRPNATDLEGGTPCQNQFRNHVKHLDDTTYTLDDRLQQITELEVEIATLKRGPLNTTSSETFLRTLQKIDEIHTQPHQITTREKQRCRYLSVKQSLIFLQLQLSWRKRH